MVSPAGQLTGRCQSVMAACSTASPRDRTQVITVDVCSLIAHPSAAGAAAAAAHAGCSASQRHDSNTLPYSIAARENLHQQLENNLLANFTVARSVQLNFQ